MIRPVLLAALIAAPIGFAPAQSATLPSLFSGFFAFGDSLSDAGNLFAATGGTQPPPVISIGGTDFAGYFAGRVSNGPVWTERFTTQFAAAGLPTGNFAFALANAVPNADPVPDLPLQLGLFSALFGSVPLGPNPLAAIWAGANDLFRAVDDPATNIAVAEATGVAAALSVAGSVSALSGAGFGDFLLFNLPDLGATPAYALFQPDRAPVATAGTLAFNATLGAQAAALRATGLNVVEVDIAGLFTALLADPTAFGLTDATNPCIIGAVSQGVFLSVCDPSTIPGRVFYDPVHPTTAVHALVADAVEARFSVQPVPVPAALPLLVSGLVLLVAARRRRS